MAHENQWIIFQVATLLTVATSFYCSSLYSTVCLYVKQWCEFCDLGISQCWEALRSPFSTTYKWPVVANSRTYEVQYHLLITDERINAPYQSSLASRSVIDDWRFRKISNFFVVLFKAQKGSETETEVRHLIRSSSVFMIWYQTSI